jgi:type IV pilus assembly protein PilC
MTRFAGPTRYVYLAARPDGRRAVGTLRARDPRHLAEQLRRTRLVPLRTWEVPSWVPGQEAKVRLRDQAEVHTQLAQLLNRAVPLVEALEVVGSEVGEATRPRIERMREMVAAGSSFADAANAVGIFDPVTVAVYRAAERTGDLGGAARQLAGTARRQLAISGRAGTLLIYPAIVLVVGALVTLLMLTFVLPQVGHAVTSQGGELPAFSAALVVAGVFLREHWPWALGVAFVLVGFAVGARRQLLALGRRLLPRIPLVREVLLTQESARFFTVMAAMTRCGITLGDALGVASSVISHPRLREQLTTLRTRLIEGGVLRTLIDAVDALPLATRRLLIAAERSGDLESAFETLATDMAEELETRTTRLMAILGPAITVFLFIIIGTLVLAIMIPLIRLSATAMG